MATISSSIISKLFPAYFCSSKNFNLSQISLEFSDKEIVEIPEAMIAGELKKCHGRSISLTLLLPGAFSSKYI